MAFFAEAQAALGVVVVQAGLLEPARPRRAVAGIAVPIEMDQSMLQELCGFAQPQMRTGDRQEAIRRLFVCLVVGIRAAAITDRQIGATLGEIDLLARDAEVAAA